MDISLVKIDDLKLSQIYLSQKKIDDVLIWFNSSMLNFEPITARDFLGNGNLHITDGHTRTYIAWLHGIAEIPYVYDEDEIVTCEIGQILYREAIVWCDRFRLRHISALKNRILSDVDYKELWLGRCHKMHTLKAALLNGFISASVFERRRDELQRKGLFVYGISDDYAVLYAENISGQLFEFQCFSE